MKDQHTMIKGYRDLSAEEIALMNEIKAKAAEVGDLVAKLDAIGKEMRSADAPPAPSLDHRWVAIGRTHLQEGFMALVRAVAQPTTF